MLCHNPTIWRLFLAHLWLLDCHRCHAKTLAFYSKSIKGINIKLGILAYHDKVKLQTKGHNSEIYSFGVRALFN